MAFLKILDIKILTQQKASEGHNHNRTQEIVSALSEAGREPKK